MTYAGNTKRKVTRFQQYTTETIRQFVAGEGANTIIENFSKSRITSSTTFEKKLYRIAIDEAIERENTICPETRSKWHFYAYSKDNYDLTIKGPKPGNDSWVIMLRFATSPAKLAEIGFYRRDEDKRISRTPRRTSLEEMSSEDLFHAKEYDINQYSFLILQSLQTMITLHMPTMDAMIEMEETCNYDWSLYDDIPRDYGVDFSFRSHKDLVDDDGNLVSYFLSARPSDDDDDGNGNVLGATIEEELEVIETICGRNNMFVNPPFHENLQEHKTVTKIMHVCRDQIDDILQKDQTETDPYESGEDPVLECMLASSGDGAPANSEFTILQRARMEEEEPTSDREDGKEGSSDAHDDGTPVAFGLTRKFGTFRPFAAGFHWMLEGMRLRGNALDDFTRFFISQYRPTEAMQKAIMSPRDPRQAEEEMPFYLGAFYRTAAIGCAQKKKTSGSDSDSDDSSIESGGEEVSVSPKEVHEHMLERAKEYPFVLAVLQDLRFLEIIVLLQCTEKTGSAELYIAAIRLMVPFLMTCNAPNYIRIAMETLSWWETASDAERVLFEACVLTARTAKDQPAFLDRLQEMTNTFYRCVTGKTMTPGTEKKMEKTCLNMADNQRVKKQAEEFRNQRKREHKSKYTAKESLRHTMIFVRLCCTIGKMNLFGEAPPFLDLKGEVEASADCLEIPITGEAVASAVLDAYDIGLSRGNDYADKFVLSGPTIERPVSGEDGVPIGYLLKKAKALKAEMDSIINLRTSVKYTEIDKAATSVGRNAGGPKLKLVKEIKKIRASWRSMPRTYKNLVTETLGNNDATVSDLVDCPVLIRTDFFRKHERIKKEWKDEIEAKVRERSLTSKDEREDILEAQIYSLAPEVIAREEFNVQIPFRLTDDGGVDDPDLSDTDQDEE